MCIRDSGYAVPCQRIEIVEAAHPVPDEAGLRAAQRIHQLVQGLTADDLVIALISGGGSSLLVAPAPGLSLADKQAINTALLRSGATISEMNCLRRHLSALKGGRLGAACHPAQLLTLLISDVPGDDPIDIASGPTVGDPTSCADAVSYTHLDVYKRQTYLKAQPGRMTFASSGNGSSDHLTAELFWQQTGTTGLHVPYKGGGPVMQDLLGAQVESSFMNINTAMPQIKAGKLRPLVITSARRSAQLPEVPTLEESGIKEANVQSWQAVAGPRGLPADVKAKVQGAIAAAVADPAIKARLLDLGFEIVANTPEQFAAFQAAEYARWQKLITARNIKAD